jgi:hypothetical protein
MVKPLPIITGRGVYVDSDNSIHPRDPSSHWLRVSEIQSVASLIMSYNVARAAQFLDEKKLGAPTASFFLLTGLLETVT